MPDREAADALGFDDLREKVFHASLRRTPAHPVDYCSDGVFVALNMRLDRTIGGIAHPSGDTQRASLVDGPLPKENALHAADNANAAANASHYTVAMSGASSAFMPTTL